MKLEDLFENSAVQPEAIIQWIKKMDPKAIADIDEKGLIHVKQGMVIIKAGWIDNGRLTAKFGRCEGFNLSVGTLTSADGLPKVVSKRCAITKNKKLTSLVGSPEFVGGSYFLSDNGLTSLEGIASSIGTLESTAMLDLVGNKITSLKDIHKHIKYLNGFIALDFDMIEDSILGLLKIAGFKGLTATGHGGSILKTAADFEKAKIKKNANAFLILMKYINGGPDALFDCQEELIEAGYPKLAHL